MQTDRHYAHLAWDKLASCDDTIPALLAWGADTWGTTELLVQDEVRLTYADAERQSAAFAAMLLGHGIGKGARVGVLLPNGVEFLVTWLAIVRIGAVAVPISTLSSAAELARILRSSGVSLLVAIDHFQRTRFDERLEETLQLASDSNRIVSDVVPLLRSVWLWRGRAAWSVEIDLRPEGEVPDGVVLSAQAGVTPADEATIIYTSGSTSEPKGVRHSHGAFMRSSRRWAASMPFQRDDRFFANAPMFWVGGLVTGLLSVMHVGATLVTSTSSDPAVLLDMIEGERCTLLQLWPFLTRRLVAHESFATRDFPAMRAATDLAFVPPARRPNGPNLFGLGMGMTETAGPHAIAMEEGDASPEGAMGLLSPGMEHRIVDPYMGRALPEGEHGELFVRGDTMMLGYVGREHADVFTPDGWFATGDLCSLIDDHVVFHGRADTMIKTAGANVSPAEVEDALLRVGGIAEVCVIGLPDAERGQIVGAMIVPADGVVLDPGEIARHAKALLSSYKVPRRILIATTIPLTATNKADRREVRNRLESEGSTI